jgi:hypothetical protein
MWNFAGKSTNHTSSSEIYYRKKCPRFQPDASLDGLQVSARSAQTLAHTGGDIFGIIRLGKHFGDNFAAAAAGGLSINGGVLASAHSIGNGIIQFKDLFR